MPALLPLAHHPDAAVRLYCLPPGGATEFYLPWADLLPPTVQAYAIALPGRGSRRDEPSTTDPRALTNALATLIDNPADRRPFALFGHSLGALFAYETARRLRRTGRVQPVLVALSALPAPHRGAVTRLVAGLLKSGLGAFSDLVGPVPDELLKDPDTVAHLLTPHLADMVLCLHQRHHEEPPLDTHLALYGGAADPLVPPDQLEGWNDLFTGPATPCLSPGRHTYPQENAPALVRQLTKDLQMAVR